MTRRDRTVIVVVAVVAAIVAAWLVIIQPKRSQASKLGDQVKTAQSQLQSARSLLAQNETARSTFASDYAAVARLGEAVPADDNVPSLIYQLQSAANGAHVDFRGITLVPGSGGPSASSAPPNQSSQKPPPTAGSSTTAGKTTPSTPTSPSGQPSSPSGQPSSPSATQASTASLPPGASVGAAGFPIEPFTFNFKGNFFHLADFFNRLQRFVVATNSRLSVSGRLLTLNAISLVPAQEGFPHINAVISATAYIVPPSQGITGGATPSGPSSSSAQSVSTTSSSAAPPSAAVSAPQP